MTQGWDPPSSPDEPSAGASGEAPPPPPPPPPTAPQPPVPPIGPPTAAPGATGGWSAPTAPPPAGPGDPAGPPPGAPDAPLTLQQPPVKKGKAGRIVAAVAGVALLGGGAAFALTQVSGDEGPSSPEAAVQELLDAAANEDILGALGAMHPGERRAVQPSIETMFSELQRLEVLGDTFDANGVAGVDIEFTDVTYETDQVADDVARVHITGGEVSFTAEGSELPIGDFVADLLERFEADIDELDTDESNDIEQGSDEFLVAVKTSDGWRVSLGYTIAEQARDDAGVDFDDLGEGIEPVGADSPEEAIEGFLTAVTDFDLEEVIARLSPNEFAALQAYAGLYLDEAEDGFAEGAEVVDITIDELDLDSEEDGDRATVFVRGFDVTIELAEGVATDQAVTVQASYDGDCFAIDFGDTDPAELGIDLDQFGFDGGELCGGVGGVTDSASESLGSMLGGELPELPEIGEMTPGITVAKVDGQWYLAPIATGLDGVNEFLGALDRDILDEFVDFGFAVADSFATSFEEGFEEGFSEVGTEITDEYSGDLFDPDVEGDETVDDGGIDDTFDDEEPADEIDYQALDSLISELAGDDQAAIDCLYEKAFEYSDSQLVELINVYWYGFDITDQATVDLFAEEITLCTSG